MNGFYRTQSEILTDVLRERRDMGTQRWTEHEVYRALNRALSDWHGRVSVPMIYTLPGGWNANTDTYALPAYIHGSIYPQIRYAPVTDFVTETTWVSLRMFSVEPDGDGGMVLRVRVSGNGIDLTTDGRVMWYANNSRVPLTPPALSSTIAGSDTSLTVNAAADVDDTGYVKVDNEWIAYAGVTRGASTTTLNNLQRALNGSAAASHTNGATVTWAICAPNMRLFSVLIDQILMHLHALFLSDASSKSTEHHERQMLYYENRVREAWRRHVPARSPLMVNPNTQR